MSLADYTIEFEELLYCLEKYEIKLPPVVVAYWYLSSANLTEVQGTIGRTTISDYTYDNMVKQVIAVFSESKQEQWEEKIKVKVEDESYELEETFYSNMRSNEGDNFRGNGQVRGSYRGKYKDNVRKRGERHKTKPLIEIQEKFWGVKFAKAYSILLEIVQIMCQGSLKRKWDKVAIL